MSLKNEPLSPAGTMLGLGDQLQTQLQDQLDEQAKKKKLEMATANASGALNPNTNGIGSAVASLLGTQGAQ